MICNQLSVSNRSNSLEALKQPKNTDLAIGVLQNRANTTMLGVLCPKDTLSTGRSYYWKTKNCSNSNN